MEGSTINSPHPDGPPAEDGEDFFGGGEEAAPEATLPAAAPGDEPAAPAEVAAPEEPAAAAAPQSPGSPAMIAEERERQAADQAKADAALAATAEAQNAAAEAPASDSSTSNRSGAAEREYVVLHHVPLTERALKFFLKEIEEGREVRTALLELTRIEARNVKQAAGAAYMAHKERLGDTAKLAVVPSKSFQVKTISPKQNVETTLDIS